jgi:hypothetical protein
VSTRSTSRARRELERVLGRDPLVEKVDPDTDAVKSLPETDVETEFHTRLLLMKDVRQLDDDISVFGDFGKASVPAQKMREIIANIGFTWAQAKRHRSISERQSRGSGATEVTRDSPRRTQPAPAASEPARLGALWL